MVLGKWNTETDRQGVWNSQISTQNRSWIQTKWGLKQDKPEGNQKKVEQETSRHWQRQCFGENLKCADNNSKNRQMGLCHTTKLWMAKETISWVKRETAEWQNISSNYSSGKEWIEKTTTATNQSGFVIGNRPFSNEEKTNNQQQFLKCPAWHDHQGNLNRGYSETTSHPRENRYYWRDQRHW